MKTIKNIFIAVATMSFLTGCVNDSFDIPTDECVSPTLVTNITVPTVYAATTSTPTLNTTDDIIEAVVTSSDEGGNFYKTLSLMSVDGQRGFSVSIDDYNLYTQKLQPGRKVYIKLKGLYRSIPTGGTRGLNFGGAPYPPYNTLERIPALIYKNHIIPTCTVIDEENFVKKNLTLAQLANDAYLNTLVEIDNVQFENLGVTFGNKPTDVSDKNENITDGVTSFITRTSKYSNFAGSIVPSGKGKIRGVLTKYNSTYQLIIRNERDCKMTGPRSNYSIQGGTNISFNGSLTENFESYTLALKAFPKYLNSASVGTRFWEIKQYPANTGNKYIEMNSYAGSSSPGVNADVFFMIPVDFTAANTFTFKKEARYNQGQVLRVYYLKSTDYVSGQNIDITKLVNITTSFNITYPAIGSSENSFNSAGTYNIPTTLIGTGYFIFEHLGTPTVTTTMQIDDIVIQ